MDNDEMVMAPDLQSALLCDDVRQGRSGKFILIGLFDSLGLPAVPYRQPRMFVATRWCSGQGEFRQQTRIVGPDMTTTVVQGQEIPVRLQNPEAAATNVELFVNTEFREEGTQWVEILLDGDLKIRFPLRVMRRERRPGDGVPGFG